MSWLSNLFGVGSAEPVKQLGDVVDSLFTSDEERLDKANVRRRIEQNPQLAQANVNAKQAQHRTIFVAGARPFLMWVCGLGFLFAFVINPIIAWVNPEVGQPELPIDVMMELTLGMLGLAGLRTIEKIKGVAK